MKIELNTSKVFEMAEMIPIVSTITALCCMILKTFAKINPQTPMGRYLDSLNFVYLTLISIPLINVIASMFKDRLLNKIPPIIPCIDPPIKKAPPPMDAGLIATFSTLQNRPRAAGAKNGDVFKEDDFLVVFDPNGENIPYDDHPEIIFLMHAGRHVAVQESPEGCSAGVAAMLAMDHDKIIPYDDFASRKASAWDRIETDLKNIGLVVTTKDVKELEDAGSLQLCPEKLNTLIRQDGPCCVRIQPEDSEMAHWIVIDEVDIELKTVTLRDPWHGFYCTVVLDAFCIQWRHAWKKANEKGLTCRTIQVKS